MFNPFSMFVKLLIQNRAFELSYKIMNDKHEFNTDLLGLIINLVIKHRLLIQYSSQLRVKWGFRVPF